MSETVAKLLEQIIELPAEDQRVIAEHVLDRLDAGKDAGDVPTDPEFLAELVRRMESIADGTAELVDGEEVFRGLRERSRARRQS